ncbi:MAG: hypothetical protein R2788_18120 [Saprospiraceae bacterium]
MDKIEFISRMSIVEDYQVIDVYINGFNLINIISTEEQSLFPVLHISAHPGQYEGIPPLLSLPPKQHYWGIADNCYQISKGRVAVLESSRSGVPNEWTISVQIIVDGEKVVWKDFYHEQLDIKYENIPSFEFELVAYKKAIHAA